MVLKIIDAIEAKVGVSIIVDGTPCTVRSIDVSKTGKHGASKCRIEAESIFDGKKKVVAVPGHERFEVPMIDKRKGQVVSISNDKASVMDLENFETMDMVIDETIKSEIKDNDNIEYWDIEGKKIIKRKA